MMNCHMCGHTVVTHETYVRSVWRPQQISSAPPHPQGMQEHTDPPLAGFVRLVPP